jgi:hypothetical protein
MVMIYGSPFDVWTFLAVGDGYHSNSYTKALSDCATDYTTEAGPEFSGPSAFARALEYADGGFDVRKTATRGYLCRLNLSSWTNHSINVEVYARAEKNNDVTEDIFNDNGVGLVEDTWTSIHSGVINAEGGPYSAPFISPWYGPLIGNLDEPDDPPEPSYDTTEYLGFTIPSTGTVALIEYEWQYSTEP